MRRTGHTAFTIVEMLVVISIITVLVGILLPAISGARTQAKVAQSQANLRQLGTAHANYASEWNDRQFTLNIDDISSFALPDEGNPDPDGCITGPAGPINAVKAYECKHRSFEAGRRDLGLIPPVELGWTRKWTRGDPVPGDTELYSILRGSSFPEGFKVLMPIAFSSITGDPQQDRPRFGWFRLPNARQFSQYLSGNFYDPVFYAPKDTVVMNMLADTRDYPGEYVPRDMLEVNYGWSEFDFCYSSYSLSPAALFAPEVMRNPGQGGWQDPWSLPGGFRTPAMSQARYPNLKTHMLEHHWLQKARADCNPNVVEEFLRPYKGCQPYFFNQSRESSPATLFYDGHVAMMGVGDAERADLLQKGQVGYGLWSRDTPFGEDGYWIGRGYDQSSDEAGTSFHILTTDGIRGRDWVSGG